MSRNKQSCGTYQVIVNKLRSKETEEGRNKLQVGQYLMTHLDLKPECHSTELAHEYK